MFIVHHCMHGSSLQVHRFATVMAFALSYLFMFQLLLQAVSRNAWRQSGQKSRYQTSYADHMYEKASFRGKNGGSRIHVHQKQITYSQGHWTHVPKIRQLLFMQLFIFCSSQVCTQRDQLIGSMLLYLARVNTRAVFVSTRQLQRYVMRCLRLDPAGCNNVDSDVHAVAAVRHRWVV